MPRVLRIVIAFFVSPFVACGSIDPTASPDAGTAGVAGGNGGMDGGSGAGGWGGAAGGIDAGDASCPSTDASPPCEKALTSDIFDPGEVYMAGALNDGSGYGLAHLRCPNVAVADFSNSSGESYIRPTDGRLLYRHLQEPSIREFHMDGCLHVAGATNDRFVSTRTANDHLFWGVCPEGSSADEFLISPEGFFMLHCDGASWRDIGGEHVYSENRDGPLLHLGYGNLALTATRVIDLSTGAGPLIVRPDGFIHAIRAVPPDKFWIVLRLNADASQALFEVNRDGLVTQLGTFPTPPSGTVVGTTGRLDKNGALYQFTTRRKDTTAEYESVVIRRDIGGRFEFVYEEGSKPFVRAGTLITGP
jgi:hypothetical protein